MNEAILFVDDEKAILRALNRAFLGSSYEILTAESGEAALEILRRKKLI
jgi:CheY-like chemotaxis protein